MLCCANCFSDPWLSEYIASKSNAEGRCDYCLSEKMAVIEPSSLYDLFYMVADAYQPGDEHNLLYWFRNDWGILEENNKLPTYKAENLLGSIMEDPNLMNCKFSPINSDTSNQVQAWDNLSAELRERNRYFPDPKIGLDHDRFEKILSYIRSAQTDKIWFRARINRDDGPFQLDQMGAPPRNIASHGRANPPGIQYLYLGSTPKTAIAEIRPHIGDVATVAEFHIAVDGLRLVDLTSPKHLVSPFSVDDSDNISELRYDVSFLERLGSELTNPVRPQSAPIDYVPSQYLCEFIKTRGWHGVLYRSSVAEGRNLALFDPNTAQGLETTSWKVDNIVVDCSRLDS